MIDSLIALIYKSEKRLGYWLHHYKRHKLIERLRSVGHSFSIGRGFQWQGLEQIYIGNNCTFNHESVVNGAGGLHIGDNCIFAARVTIWTVNHNIHGDRLPFDDKKLCRPVIIGNNVWVGINVTIVPGSIIGDGCVIGAGTVISGQVPAKSIVGGQKWRILGERDHNHYQDHLPSSSRDSNS